MLGAPTPRKPVNGASLWDCLIIACDSPFWGVLLDQRRFPPLSSIRICLCLVGIYSVAWLIRRWWTWIFKTMMHTRLNVYISMPSVLQWMSGVCLPRGLLGVLILFSCYLSIQHFSYILSFTIFYFKIVLFLWVQVADSSLCTFLEYVISLFIDISLFWKSRFVFV